MVTFAKRNDYQKLPTKDDGHHEEKTRLTKFSEKLRQTKMKVMMIGTTSLFLSGLDRSIVIPTLSLYLEDRFSVETAHSYYAVTLAFPNLLSIIASPVYAYIEEKELLRTKMLIVVTNIAAMIGSLLYFIGPTAWVILIGRGITGIAQCLNIVLMTELARCTTIKERTAYTAIWLMFRQAAYAIGPAINLLTNPTKFHIFGFLVDVYNIPGLLIAFLRILHIIAAVLIYPDLSRTHVKEDGTAMECNDVVNDIEDEVLDDLKKKSKTCKEITREFFRFESLAIVIIIFTSNLALMGLEASMPLAFQRYFGWDQKFTSLVFLGMAVLIIVLYIFVSTISQKVPDRILLLVGLLALFASSWWLTVIMIYINSEQRSLYIGLTLTAIFGFTIGQPFAFAASDSLLTKCIQLDMMETAQAVRNIVVVSGYMIGMGLGGLVGCHYHHASFSDHCIDSSCISLSTINSVTLSLT